MSVNPVLPPIERRTPDFSGGLLFAPAKCGEIPSAARVTRLPASSGGTAKKCTILVIPELGRKPVSYITVHTLPPGTAPLTANATCLPNTSYPVTPPTH